jgi:hypothetical protein
LFFFSKRENEKKRITLDRTLMSFNNTFARPCFVLAPEYRSIHVEAFDNVIHALVEGALFTFSP